MSSACTGVKCRKVNESNVLNHKKNARATPHGADYLHDSPRDIRAGILHSDSISQQAVHRAFGGQGIELGTGGGPGWREFLRGVQWMPVDIVLRYCT